MLFVQYVAATGNDVLRVGSLLLREFLDESVLFHHWTTFEQNDLKHLSGSRQVPDGDESQTKLAMRKLFSEWRRIEEERRALLPHGIYRRARVDQRGKAPWFAEGRHPKLFGSAREQWGKA